MRRVGALIFPGFELLDLFGPLEMFGLLPDLFALELVAEHADPVISNQQVRAQPDAIFAEAGPYDLLLVPGGSGTRVEASNDVLLDYITQAAAQSEIVMSVCTGSPLLAKAGLLDGRRATINKAAFAKIAVQGPKVNWVTEARWVEDDKFVTSSGVSAGMDMSLAVIAKLHGMETADQVATWAEYDWHQDRDWDPFAKLYGLI